MTLLRRHGLKLPVLLICFVFVQSLYFKFTRHPETTYIFETRLDPWAASLGFPGLFAPGGLFSARVIGSAELLAAALLLFGTVVPGRLVIQGLGALLSLAVISGAIGFHLFTPLGISVIDAEGRPDHGALFAMACLVWLSSLVVIAARRHELLALVRSRP